MECYAAWEKYREHLVSNLGRSRETVKGTRSTVLRFIKWFEGEGGPGRDTVEFTADIVADYVTTSFGHHSDNTYNLYITHLNGWLKWLWERKLLGEDQAPWRFLNRRRKPQRVRPKEFIRRDERDEVSVKMGARHPRDEHFVRGLYGSARRIGELLAMKVGDIDLTSRPGMPRGIFTFDNNKGRRRRVTLPIPPDFHRELKEWLPLYAELIGRPLQPDDYLYPAMRTGKGARGIKGLRMNMVLRPKLRFSYTSAQQHIKDNTGKTAHGFRRGSLSDLKHDRQASGKGDGVRLAKTLADHANESTTEEYMDEYEDRDALARAFDEMDPASPPVVPKVASEVAGNKVVDLTAHRRAKRAG